MFPRYSILKRVVELEREIKEKDKLEIGDPHFREYYRIMETIKSASVRDLIGHVQDLERHYESECQEKVADAERERDAVKRKLEEIAELIEPYLPKQKK